MLYVDRTPNVNTAGPVVIITRRTLKRYPKYVRATMIADYKDKKLDLRFSSERLAVALEVSATYANAAERTSPAARDGIRRGLRPLILPPPPPPTDDEILAGIVARIGVDRALEIVARAEQVALAA